MFPSYQQPNYFAGAERQAAQQAQAMRPAQPQQQMTAPLPSNAGSAFVGGAQRGPGSRPFSPPIATRQPNLPPQQPRPQSLSAMYGGMRG